MQLWATGSGLALVASWANQLQPHNSTLLQALHELAQGRLQSENAILTAFCCLLKSEAYDACLEVFEKLTEVREAEAGSPVTSTLFLELPADWSLSARPATTDTSSGGNQSATTGT